MAGAAHMNGLQSNVQSLWSMLPLDWLHDVAFFWPSWLVLLGAAVFGAAAFWLLDVETRRRRDRLTRFAELALLPRLGAALPSRHTVLRQWPVVIAMCLLALALAQPTAGYRTSFNQQRGLDVVLAIDASASMLATDEQPSRLERLKQEVRRFRASGPGDRVGLIAFAGRSYILTPLTADVGALDLYIDNLSPETVGQGGSAMSGAMRQGVELLDASASGSDRVLVLLSDGEFFEPDTDLRAAAALARERGVAVVTVGFGTPLGATIPVRENGRTVAKRDEAGRIVTTRYMPSTLQAIADWSGGAFVDAGEADRAGRARDALRALRTALRAAQQQRDRIARFSWLVVPALLLLLHDTTRSGNGRRTGRARRAPSRASDASVTAVLLAMVTVPLLGCGRPSDPARVLAAGDTLSALAQYRTRVAAGDSTPAARYNVGTALLLADSLPVGVAQLEEVRRDADGSVLARAQYNEGTALLEGARAAPRGGDRLLARSRAQLRAYLTAHPDDADAVWNYELALRRGVAGGGGGASGDAPSQGGPQPLDAAQSDALLRSAARDERDVQARKLRSTRPLPPRSGKDW